MKHRIPDDLVDLSGVLFTAMFLLIIGFLASIAIVLL